MTTIDTQRIWTDDELFGRDRDGRKHEIWHGKLMTMAPAGSEHGDAIMRLAV